MSKPRLKTRIIVKLTETEKSYLVNNLPEGQTISEAVRKLLRDNKLIPLT